MISALQFLATTLTGVLAFSGQQIGKEREYQRQQETKLIQMRWDACEKLKQCDPLIHYLDPPAGELIGPPAPEGVKE